MSNKNHLPTTGNSSRPWNDPLNLVKVSTNPLADKAKETIQILEEQKTNTIEEPKRQESDSWINQLDNWKSKRRSVQPSRVMDLNLSDSFEESSSVTHPPEDLIKHEDQNKTKSPQATNSKSELPDNCQEQNAFTQKSVETCDKDTLENVEPLNTSSKPTESASSAFNNRNHSIMTTSLMNSSLNSTPKEALRRPNTSITQAQRPKSSMVISNAPKVPQKNFKLVKTIKEIESDSALKCKNAATEEKTAQASIKKFNHIKNFFEKASTSHSIERSDSNIMSSKPALRTGSRGTGVDPKKRMSLGPGILDKTSRSSVAIANDKEFIIDELFVESSPYTSKINKKPIDQFSQNCEVEPRKLTQTSARPSSKIYRLSTDEESHSPAKADISLEDFKGMISVPDTSVKFAPELKMKTSIEKKADDDVFVTPKAQKDSKSEPEIISFPSYRGKFGAEFDVTYKSADPEGKTGNDIESGDLERTNKLHKKKLEANENEDKFTIRESPSMSELQIHLQSADKTADDNKEGSNEPVNKMPLDCVTIDLLERPKGLSADEGVGKNARTSQPPISIFKKTNAHADTTNFESQLSETGMQQPDVKGELVERQTENKVESLDINLFSAKIDKILEELKFFPSPSKDLKSEEPAPPKVKQFEDRVTEAMPTKSTESPDDLDGSNQSTNEDDPTTTTTSRAKVGLFLEKKFSKERIIPGVTSSKEADVGKQKSESIGPSTKSAIFPKVPPKPSSRSNSYKVKGSTPMNIRYEQNKTSHTDEGIDLNASAKFNLLDISASRSKVELSRKVKRRPPSVKGRFPSLEDLLDSTPKNAAHSQGFVENRNGHLHSYEILQDKNEAHKRDDSLLEDESDRPPALPSCPPPPDIHETPLIVTATVNFVQNETAAIMKLRQTKELRDSDSDEDLMPESSV